MSDFTDILDIRINFDETELDLGVDFIETSDFGTITVLGSGFGEGGFGEGPFGGTASYSIPAPNTEWIDVDEP